VPASDAKYIKWLDFQQGGPPGLDKESDPAEMDAGFSPDAYGINLDTEGRLAKGTVPAGTARINKTVTNVNGSPGDTFDWHYQRLWRFSGTSLIFGAPYYDDVYYRQGIGKILFDEDALTIVEFLPFGRDSMAIGKSTGSYVLGNLNDTRGEAFWTRSDIIQEVKLGNKAHATELDGVSYFSTATGLFAFSDSGQVEELTRPIRNTIGNFGATAILPDYQKKRIIGTSTWVYDAERKKIYDYGTTGFRWTSPQFHDERYEPMVVDRLHFAVQNADPTSDQEFTLQIKSEEQDWSDEERVDVVADRGSYSVVSVEPEMYIGRSSPRRLQIRITDMSTNLRIRAIYADVVGKGFDHYSE
jgi:hypothetical protein